MFGNKPIEKPFSEAEQQRIIDAIQLAELATSGEIRLHVDLNCSKPALNRAEECFNELGMSATELRNGVLIYLCLNQRTFAIIGDKGINEKVPSDFWDCTRDIMSSHFKNTEMVEGICAGIRNAGEQLKLHFPVQIDDKDELSNDISFGNHEE